jgi:hypothetical protein
VAVTCEVFHSQTKAISGIFDQSVRSMAPHLSKDLHDRVVKWRTDHCYTYRKLADLAGCSIETIANILTIMVHQAIPSTVTIQAIHVS